MKVLVKIYASLREYTEDEGTMEVEIPEDSEVTYLLNELEIPENEVKNIMINGIRSKPYRTLREGDRVALFPKIAGG
jgi:molybdopterin converting factor small subunit